MTQEHKLTDADLIKLNKEIAYHGAIGHLREIFCVRYIEHKKDVIRQISGMQKEKVMAANKVITCQKSCIISSCCMEYVDATVQECEAIVYYLNHNEAALQLFLNNYPLWRERVSRIEDILKTLERASFEFITLPQKEIMRKGSHAYFDQNILCPFLDNNLCSIYEVRPYGCVGYYVTTPLSNCDPNYSGEVPVSRHLPNAEVLDTKFYYSALQIPVLVCMPKTVYKILRKGYAYLSTIPGLKTLGKEARSDKKIKAKYRLIERSE